MNRREHLRLVDEAYIKEAEQSDILSSVAADRRIPDEVVEDCFLEIAISSGQQLASLIDIMRTHRPDLLTSILERSSLIPPESDD